MPFYSSSWFRSLSVMVLHFKFSDCPYRGLFMFSLSGRLLFLFILFCELRCVRLWVPCILLFHFLCSDSKWNSSLGFLLFAFCYSSLTLVLTTPLLRCTTFFIFSYLKTILWWKKLFSITRPTIAFRVSDMAKSRISFLSLRGMRWSFLVSIYV